MLIIVWLEDIFIFIDFIIFYNVFIYIQIWKKNICVSYIVHVYFCFAFLFTFLQLYYNYNSQILSQNSFKNCYYDNIQIWYW